MNARRPSRRSLAALAAIPPAEWVGGGAGVRLPAARRAAERVVLGVRRSPARRSSSCCSRRPACVMQAALQVFYIGMGVYGWRAWRGGGDGRRQRCPCRAGALRRHALAIGCDRRGRAGQWLAGRAATQGGLVPYVDAFVAWVSVLATWMVARKVLENWLYWIVLDSVAAVLYWSQGFHATAVLFVVYVADRRARLLRMAGGPRHGDAAAAAERAACLKRSRRRRAGLRRGCSCARCCAAARRRCHCGRHADADRGGLSNRAWRLEARGGTWFVRRATRTPRGSAWTAAASAACCAPWLRRASHRRVCRLRAGRGPAGDAFRRGQTWQATDVAQPGATCVASAECLRRLHAAAGARRRAGRSDYAAQARQPRGGTARCGRAGCSDLRRSPDRAFARIRRRARLDGALPPRPAPPQRGGRRRAPVARGLGVRRARRPAVRRRRLPGACTNSGRGRQRRSSAPTGASPPAIVARLADARWAFDYVQWLWYRLRLRRTGRRGRPGTPKRLAQRLLRCNN